MYNINNIHKVKLKIKTHKLKKFRPLDKGKVLKTLIIYLFKVDSAH